MIVFNIADAADQQFSTILEGRRVTFRLRYNPTNDRWSFDLAIDDVPILKGRRIVTGVDLLAPFGLGIGAIFALTATAGAAPDRRAIPDGTVRIYHALQEEIDASVQA